MLSSNMLLLNLILLINVTFSTQAITLKSPEGPKFQCCPRNKGRGGSLLPSLYTYPDVV